MATVIALSSFVARGSVGLRVVVPALHRLGHEAVALPTVILSSHLGYTRVAGTPVAAETVEAMVEALDANGWLGKAAAVITGYLPSADHVEVAASLVARMRQLRPDIPFFCDPVLGDMPEGLYVPESVAIAVRDRLMPFATYLKPNAFELGFLSGHSVCSPAEAVVAARALELPAVLASSVPAGEGSLANVLVRADQAVAASVIAEPHVPHGTGDLLTALFAGHVLSNRSTHVSEAAARAAAGVAHAIAASRGGDELLLSDTVPWHQATPLPLMDVSTVGFG